MKKLLILSASLLCSLPMLAVASSCDDGADHCAYWQVSPGVFVHNSAGECVKSVHWFEGAKVPECNLGGDDDADGVINADDRCPATLAGYPVDELGCATDSDGDGVVDGADSCPGTAPGMAVDEKGCVLDADMDGVVDASDACPNTAAGAEVDATGCEKQEVVAAETVLMQVDLKVNFDTGSSKLASGHREEIQKVADYMKQNPNTMVSIEGYTDSVGSAAANKKLSQNRANAVADVLVNEHGIESSRVEAAGMGEDNPVADNATAAGREANRRVEAVVTAK